VLGASHTTRGGTHARYASGRVRALRAAALIRRHHSDVVGFQELQGVQLATLERHTDLAFWPGFALRRPDTENSIGWRRGEWTAVDKQVVSIPYFDGGLRRMPVVRLRSVSTGLEAWFANFHNPAETSRFHHQQRYRTRATAIETRVANRLITATGLPVFVTGDMNERGAFFCRFTGRTPMVAARGGSNTGRCRPSGSGGIDWIFGSQGVDFSGYDVDRSHLVRITTDHPVVTAHVRITGDAKNPGVSGLVP
jgi:endonuclease/exonuclease/phosphatase family metal-dependent hydrolase